MNPHWRRRKAIAAVVLLFTLVAIGPGAACDPADGTRKGSGCRYRDIPGTCRIESVTPSGPNTYGPGFRTLFTFVPASENEQRLSGVRMIIGDGKDPTSTYLEENGIAPGREFPCIRKVRLHGPCSPQAFVFPGFKRVY